MEPAVKPAAAASRSGVIGVLATSSTLKSEKFELLIRQHAGHVRVLTQPCTGLVEEIEKGDFNSSRIHTLLQKYIRPLLQQGVDTLILGCTHYPLIRAQIESAAGSEVKVVDSGAAVALRLRDQLQQHGLLTGESMASPMRCWSSGDPQHLAEMLTRLWPHTAEVAALPGQ
jgi:glutamate racemase